MEEATRQSDPLRARRARIARWARAGQRLGYGLLGAAMAVFVWGATSGFTRVTVVLVVTALAAGSAVLAPSIVVGYGVRAAAREAATGDGPRRPGLSGPPGPSGPDRH